MSQVSNKEIAQAIFKGSKDKKDHELSMYFKKIVIFLNKKRLISKAPDILIKLKKIVDQEEGVLSGVVTSAHKLSNHTKHDLIHKITKRYKAKEVELEEVVDERLLGGLRIEASDEVIDLTLRNKINQLQEYLIKKAQ